MPQLLAVAVVLAALLGLGHASPLSSWVNGTAAFFGGSQEASNGSPYNFSLPAGSCGFGPLELRSWPFQNVVAVSPNNILTKGRPMGGCGTCFEVMCTGPRQACRKTGTSGSIIVKVVDTCLSCNSTTLNLHAMAFEGIAQPSFGRVRTAFRQVECDTVEGITPHVGRWRPSEGGWLRLSLKNVGSDAGIKSVFLRPAVELDPSLSAPSAGATTTTDGAAPVSTSSSSPSSPPAAAAAGLGLTAATTPASATTGRTPSLSVPVQDTTAQASAAAAKRVNVPFPVNASYEALMAAIREPWFRMYNTWGAIWEANKLPLSHNDNFYDLLLVDAWNRTLIISRAMQLPDKEQDPMMGDPDGTNAPGSGVADQPIPTDVQFPPLDPALIVTTLANNKRLVPEDLLNAAIAAAKASGGAPAPTPTPGASSISSPVGVAGRSRLAVTPTPVGVPALASVTYNASAAAKNKTATTVIPSTAANGTNGTSTATSPAKQKLIIPEDVTKALQQQQQQQTNGSSNGTLTANPEMGPLQVNVPDAAPQHTSVGDAWKGTLDNAGTWSVTSTGVPANANGRRSLRGAGSMV